MPSLLAVALIFTLATPSLSPSPQAPAAEQSPTTRLVPFSGVLTDAAGGPLTGAQEVTFTFFDQVEGGSPLWTESQAITVDAHGGYVAYLGTTVALPLDAFRAEQARWLEVSVRGHALPRIMLVAVPYALKAIDAETLGGAPASRFVMVGPDGRPQTLTGTDLGSPQVDGSGVPNQLAKWATGTTISSSVITESSTNRIGFGLTDPTGGGVVDSVFTIKNYDNNTGFGILNETQQRRFAINTLANGGWLMYDGGNGTWNSGLTQVNGNVAIGTSPTSFARFSVVPSGPQTAAVLGTNWSGQTGVQGAGAMTGVYGWTFTGWGVTGEANTTGGGVWGRASSGIGVSAASDTGTALTANSNTGTYIATFTGPGNVGIGTSSPLDKLDVRGDIRVGTGTTGCVKDADGTLLAGTCSSDLQLKKNVAPFGRSLEAVTQLQPVFFDWRADEFPGRYFGVARSFGLIAQDVERVLPDLVTTGNDGLKAVKYSQLPFYMLQAIKDLKEENDSLKQQLQAQGQQLKSQDERLRQLERLGGK